jgi:sialate O-acetylesterase
LRIHASGALCGRSGLSGDEMVVWSERVPHPVAVRYAWHYNPLCNLYNGADLPASPFRTDGWPGLSQGVP